LSDYDNTNRFVLFKNDKQGNEKRPDYTGTIDINGTEYRLSAWIKESKNGNKFMSGAVGEASPSQQQAPQQQAPQFEDDVPF
jgi:hypothetical protein